MNTTNINHWYIYDGIKGVLAWEDNGKFAGVEPVETCMGVAFYSLESISGRNITDNDCLVEYYDSYDPIGNPSNIHEEIVCEQVVNIENHQQLVDCFCNKMMYQNDLYERMMCKRTDVYCQWDSVLTRTIDYACDEWDRIKDLAISEKYGNEMDFATIEQEEAYEREITEKAIAELRSYTQSTWQELSAPYQGLNTITEEKTFESVWQDVMAEIDEEIFH